MAAVGDGESMVIPAVAGAGPMDLMEALRETLKNAIVADGITKGNSYIHFLIYNQFNKTINVSLFKGLISIYTCSNPN